MLLLQEEREDKKISEGGSQRMKSFTDDAKIDLLNEMVDHPRDSVSVRDRRLAPTDVPDDVRGRHSDDDLIDTENARVAHHA